MNQLVSVFGGKTGYQIYGWNKAKREHIKVGSEATQMMSNAAMSPRDSYLLDKKYDDGLAWRDNDRITARIGLDMTAGACVTDQTTHHDYNVDSTEPECYIYFSAP